ncbi:hypothetical protein E2C01_017841 [Portunus trituberculatus]|uniref:Uncharacterized protein n=1 Tax=Portunus trituberculatus TaxID=210409 RepID=A0A5B7DTJ6_PORTR|nr:hypothetical protein [Portunus trituberculatus]
MLSCLPVSPPYRPASLHPFCRGRGVCLGHDMQVEWGEWWRGGVVEAGAAPRTALHRPRLVVPGCAGGSWPDGLGSSQKTGTSCARYATLERWLSPLYNSRVMGRGRGEGKSDWEGVNLSQVTCKPQPVM